MGGRMLLGDEGGYLVWREAEPDIVLPMFTAGVTPTQRRKYTKSLATDPNEVITFEDGRILVVSDG